MSRRLRDIVDHAEELQYHIELQVAGCEERPHPRAHKTLDVRERRELLRQHAQMRMRRAIVWRPVVVPMTDLDLFVDRGADLFTFYKGNLYISCRGDLMLGGQYFLHTVHCLSFGAQPVQSGDEPALVPKVWSRTFFDTFTMVGVDPQQNLLVLGSATSGGKPGCVE